MSGAEYSVRVNDSIPDALHAPGMEVTLALIAFGFLFAIVAVVFAVDAASRHPP
jgi:hypothetical protein